MDTRIEELTRQVQSLTEQVERLKSGKLETITLTKGLFMRSPDGDLKAAFVLLEGAPALALYNDRGVAVSIEGEGPSISLNDPEGRQRLKLKLSDEHEPMMTLMDEGEAVRISVSALKDSPRVMLSDEADRLRIALSLAPCPRIQIYGEDKTTRVNLSLEPEGGFICTLGEDQQIVSAL